MQFIPQGAFTQDAVNAALLGDFILHAVNSAIDPRKPGRRLITKGSLCALTLAAPRVGLDDGLVIEVISTTAFAHTLTATGLLKTGSASVNVATFAANAGASVRLVAYNGLWFVEAQIAITFS